jgi:hypothetical protein
VTAGALTPQDADEKHLREAMNLPELDEAGIPNLSPNQPTWPRRAIIKGVLANAFTVGKNHAVKDLGVDAVRGAKGRAGFPRKRISDSLWGCCPESNLIACRRPS